MTAKQKFDHPDHPTVDWNTLQRGEDRRLIVQVTCPHCLKARWDYASQVSYRIRKGTHSGYCYKDRLIGTVKSGRADRPNHSQIDWGDTILSTVGKQRHVKVAVVCPVCYEKRYMQPAPIAKQIRLGSFTGRCRSCGGAKRKLSPRPPGHQPRIENGYVVLARRDISPEDMEYFMAMRTKKWNVSEHRLVMARLLGRPLEPYELVDHMNGNKQDNSPDNLRIYVKGKNHPGSHNGHGTYYHEWQMALVRIKELETELSE